MHNFLYCGPDTGDFLHVQYMCLYMYIREIKSCLLACGYNIFLFEHSRTNAPFVNGAPHSVHVATIIPSRAFLQLSMKAPVVPDR